ncbi:semaphorin-4G [Mixophyes fleayi]|uniref:semaphorin-4G n=1 Tax=Mixophyes fleayi TaxID=3061075 RepID=UPI003F4E1034
MKKHVICYFVVFCAIIIGYSSKRSTTDMEATPRITVKYNELSEVKQFSDDAKNYNTLLLEDEHGILYVGARGAIFSLNLSDISHGSKKTIPWEVNYNDSKSCQLKGKNNQTECFNHIRLLQRFNQTHLYVCGTYAFAPKCCYIDVKTFRFSKPCEDEKDKCPYDPTIGYTGLLIDGVLYTASGYGFHSVPDIRRDIVPPTLKTEATPLHWLIDAEFVTSALVRESLNSTVGDDDKIYYFFNERVMEESSEFLDKTQVARVARVCKSDMGGKKILQKKWTSFLKARLVCSMPYYETLKSMYTLEVGSWDKTVFYGAFILQWRNLEASAVCRYSISVIRKVFEGPYMEYQDSTRKWARYKGDVPKPRPGSCITNEFRNSGYNVSQDLPNNVLDFVKLHPLVYEQVKPDGELPLLMKKNIIYTRIAVDRVTALDKEKYDVLFLGTDNGWIHKAVIVNEKVHIIEEIQVFKKPQPVENLVISKKENSLYIGAQSEVLQLSLSSCNQYTSCYDCHLARNPYCGWDGNSCREPLTSQDWVQMTQDMQNGNGGCLNNTDDAAPVMKLQTVLKGYDVLLQCDLRSNLASAQWLVNGTDPLEGDEGHLRVGVDGLLITDALLEHSGEYSCYSEESGLQFIVASYNVTVLLELPKVVHSDPTPIVPLPTAAQRSSSNLEFVYISVITVLGGLCLVLSIVLLYVYCQQKRKGKYAMGNSRITSVELQTVSSNFKDKSEELNNYSDGCLQIIPGEAPTASPRKLNPPPPPPPPPLPSEFTNGISTLPNMLRKINGNSYMLLRQSEESSSPLYNSFTEELSKILEKRKHTQLVEKLDESSV